MPHFEKMLYDNALLAEVYLEAYLASGESRYRAVVVETLDYLLRDMTDPLGGFYSAEDADSEGEEGKFYVWTPDEIRQVLGDEAGETFCKVYDVTSAGNFESKNILNLHKTIAQQAKLMNRHEQELADELQASRHKLFAARNERPRPGRDDKVLVGWNALAIDTFAKAGAALGEPRYVDAAKKAADFILRQLCNSHWRLQHTWREGKAKLAAYLDDYTTLSDALVSLYEATFDEKYIVAAEGLMDTVLARFGGGDDAGFYFTADDHEKLLTRSKDFTDNATPGGNSMAAMALLRLGKLLGRSDYLDAAHGVLSAAGPLMQSNSHGHGTDAIGARPVDWSDARTGVRWRRIPRFGPKSPLLLHSAKGDCSPRTDCGWRKAAKLNFHQSRHDCRGGTLRLQGSHL